MVVDADLDILPGKETAGGNDWGGEDMELGGDSDSNKGTR